MRHPPNRRWPALAVAVVLLVGGAFAWSHRPLNGTERRLIGEEWTFRDGGFVRVICFAESRRYLIITGGEARGVLGEDRGLLAGVEIERGDWQVAHGSLSLSRDDSRWSTWDDLVQGLRNFADGERAVESLDLEFDPDGRLWVLCAVRPGVMQLESWDRSSEEARPAVVREHRERVE